MKRFPTATKIFRLLNLVYSDSLRHQHSTRTSSALAAFQPCVTSFSAELTDLHYQLAREHEWTTFRRGCIGRQQVRR